MSDNLALMQGSGALLATDEILGVHVLRAKVQTGAGRQGTSRRTTRCPSASPPACAVAARDPEP